MTGGFQNKYYFFKETEHQGERLTKNSPGYISFWESTGILKINILLENITGNLPICRTFLEGGNNRMKIAEFTLKKNNKNSTYGISLSFKTKLPDGLSISDFDTAYICIETNESTTSLFETHSQMPCKKVQEEKAQTREEHAKKHETPDAVFSDLKCFDPFETTNHSYKWWLCENYTRVCDTLHKMDIHLPTYVAKTLYANMQFYKHAILGKYTSIEDRCFIIVGIPVQELPRINNPQSPARPMACRRFINNSGYKGYLLFYIDYATTALVKAVVV
ncbi:MAG: hypothetical protein E7384_04615 [Ruminococcaceae bacterium]|nr:hypothetical protein [Oscillospiraceae bacterium]